MSLSPQTFWLLAPVLALLNMLSARSQLPREVVEKTKKLCNSVGPERLDMITNGVLSKIASVVNHSHIRLVITGILTGILTGDRGQRVQKPSVTLPLSVSTVPTFTSLRNTTRAADSVSCVDTQLVDNNPCAKNVDGIQTRDSYGRNGYFP